MYTITIMYSEGAHTITYTCLRTYMQAKAALLVRDAVFTCSI